MTRRCLALASLLLAASCQRQDAGARDPQIFAEDALSVVPPSGWQVKRQKDTLVFVAASPEDEDATPPVIAIRTVPISDGAERRTAETVLPSLKTVLMALPGAEVTGPTDLAHPAYRAHAFDVVFTPRSKRGKKYQRRHVVLEADQHLYHAFLTAPAGELERSLPEFERVLASLREEV